MLTSTNTTRGWQRLWTQSATNSCILDLERGSKCFQPNSCTCFNQQQFLTRDSFPSTRHWTIYWAIKTANKLVIRRLFCQRSFPSLSARSLFRRSTQSESTAPYKAFPKTKASWKTWTRKWTDTDQSLKNKEKGFEAELCCHRSILRNRGRHPQFLKKANKMKLTWTR